MTSQRFSTNLVVAVSLLISALSVLPLPAAEAASCTPGNQVDKTAFFTAVAQKLVNPSVPAGAIATAVQAFIKWEPFENTKACWNPLATTLAKPGSTRFNPAGVQNYPDFQTGVLATADTLNLTFNGQGAYYAPIRKMMARQEFNATAIQAALKGWVGSEAYAASVTNLWRALYPDPVFWISGRLMLIQLASNPQLGLAPNGTRPVAGMPVVLMPALSVAITARGWLAETAPGGYFRLHPNGGANLCLTTLNGMIVIGAKVILTGCSLRGQTSEWWRPVCVSGTAYYIQNASGTALNVPLGGTNPVAQLGPLPPAGSTAQLWLTQP